MISSALLLVLGMVTPPKLSDIRIIAQIFEKGKGFFEKIIGFGGVTRAGIDYQ